MIYRSGLEERDLLIGQRSISQTLYIRDVETMLVSLERLWGNPWVRRKHQPLFHRPERSLLTPCLRRFHREGRHNADKKAMKSLTSGCGGWDWDGDRWIQAKSAFRWSVHFPTLRRQFLDVICVHKACEGFQDSSCLSFILSSHPSGCRHLALPSIGSWCSWKHFIWYINPVSPEASGEVTSFSNAYFSTCE